MERLRLFYLFWGTAGLAWGLFHSSWPSGAWLAAGLGILTFFLLHEYPEQRLFFSRLTLLICFVLGVLGLWNNAPGGWMMIGLLGYATLYALVASRAVLPRALSQRHFWRRLFLLHLLIFLLSTLLSWLERGLSPSWYLAWGADLGIGLFYRLEARRG
jgi:hypothetical protein